MPLKLRFNGRYRDCWFCTAKNSAFIFAFCFSFFSLCNIQNSHASGLACDSALSLVESKFAGAEVSSRLLDEVNALISSGRYTNLPNAWTRLMSRTQGELVESETLVPNVTHGAIKVFRPWFENADTRSNTEKQFVAMLRAVHLATVLGPFSKSISDSEKHLHYAGASSGATAERIFPGTFRFEIQSRWSAGSATAPQTVHFDVFFVMESSEVASAFYYSKVRSLIPRGSMEPKNTSIGFTQIEGIPEVARSKRLFLQRKSEGDRLEWKHEYAPAEATPLYLKEMASKMVAIKRLHSDGARLQPTARAKVVELLADYHHLFINGLPFLRVNNSIAMAQVNVVLLSFGMNGVSHRWADFVALGLSTKQYRKYFAELVAETNPL